MARRRDGTEVVNSVDRVVSSGRFGLGFEPGFDHPAGIGSGGSDVLVRMGLRGSGGDVHARFVRAQELSSATQHQCRAAKVLLAAGFAAGRLGRRNVGAELSRTAGAA